MARIIKLHVEATAETTVETQPDIQRFFYELDQDQTDTTFTIEVNDFEDDTGATPTALPELAEDNSYYNVYINGVLQMDETSSYTPGEQGTGQLAITVPDDQTITAGTPVILEVSNFGPDAETDVTITT
ncbi:hypothetical protein J2S74_002707 [Evansella vedderi]|uniref:DUF4183 domain-containing protein n=1 Tax=Evansella vedderi TaxID=38282 RepID=A0ABT9ZYZ2_9BACI|nr:DUF4183 domain-containing protein [Evansella vedderi]MDQ0255325.1 hypothetical protein [Evansella vedderi]